MSKVEHWGDPHENLDGVALFGNPLLGGLGEKLQADLEDSQPGIGFANWHGKSYAVLTAPIFGFGSALADYQGTYRAKKWNPIQHLDFPVHAVGGIALAGSPRIVPNPAGGLIQPTAPILKVNTPSPVGKNFSFGPIGFQDSKMILKMRVPVTGAQLKLGLGGDVKDFKFTPKASLGYEDKLGTFHKGNVMAGGYVSTKGPEANLYLDIKKMQFGQRLYDFRLEFGLVKSGLTAPKDLPKDVDLKLPDTMFGGRIKLLF